VDIAEAEVEVGCERELAGDVEVAVVVVLGGCVTMVT